jgi:curved DNA-binding protein CbpA
MNFDGNHYEVLGVLPTADEAVIKAAYRALAKKYHPDVSRREDGEAQRIFRRINKAYEILKDDKSREQYDLVNGISDTYETRKEEKFSEFDEEWNYLLKFYPEANEHINGLEALSPSLAHMYRLYFLDNPQSENYREIATALEQDYFERYFGKNLQIRKLAKHLIKMSQVKLAKELNRTVKFFGKNVNSETAYRIMEKLNRDSEFNIFHSIEQLFKETDFNVMKYTDDNKGMYLIKDSWGITYRKEKSLGDLLIFLSKINGEK